jgi:hypothetical protein
VVSPSGRLYSREAILEYLLNEMRKIREQRQQHEWELKAMMKKEDEDIVNAKMLQIKGFEQSQVGIDNVSSMKRKTEDEGECGFSKSRKQLIDDTDHDKRLASLQAVCPWLPQFTPSAEIVTKAPPKRPSSPFSGLPLRTKDLIPVNLIKEESLDKSGPVRFICPIARKTITTQKVILIKSTGTLMLESTAKETCFKQMRDPITNKSFTSEDILELVSATSGFAASGNVTATKYRPTIN